jgi:hypothetical protein
MIDVGHVTNPHGFRLTTEQQIVWDWATSHGLTLLADDCNDLLWRLEKGRDNLSPSFDATDTKTLF